MKNLTRLLCTAMVLVVMPGMSWAEDKKAEKTELQQKAMPILSTNIEDARMAEMPKETYQQIGKLARDNLGKAQLPDGSFITETEESKKDPLLKDADRKRVIDRGFISTFADWCGLDWKNRSFFPFMEYERLKGKWSDKDMAYMGMLHGVSMGVLQTELKKKGDCPADSKKRVELFLVQPVR